MRLALNDFNPVIDPSFFVLVMGVTNCPLPDDLPIERVPNFARHFYAKRLGRLCAGNNTNQSLFQRSTLFRLRFHAHAES
ncbi:MAG: hypothetical protein ACI8P0_003252 [Planctomycetaceae bacterium]|jgi:hypothetical protein